MKCILIHGPEASGKLDVAKSLQQQTGFKLFHNHVGIVGHFQLDLSQHNFGQSHPPEKRL